MDTYINDVLDTNSVLELWPNLYKKGTNYVG